ncbi:MAG: hypothetical protein R3B09_34960, partial [Nannocystaceae bacterium]
MSHEEPTIVDELDRPIELTKPHDQPPIRDPDAGAPPSLVDLPRDLWPVRLSTHPRVLSDPGPAESAQRLADTLLAESGHRSGYLRQVLAGESGRILIQELGQTAQGDEIVRECGSEVPGLLVQATRDPLFDLTAALEELRAEGEDPAGADAARAAAWIEHGVLCEERAADPESALASYRAALELVADHPVALGLAAYVSLTLDRPSDARAFFDAAIRGADGALAAALRLERALCTDDPGERRAILEKAGPTPAALRRLLPLVRAAGEPTPLSALYRRLAAAVVDDPLAAGTALHQALTALGERPPGAEATLTAIRAWLVRVGSDAAAFPLLAEVTRTLEHERQSGAEEVAADADYVEILERLYPYVDDLHEQAVIREQLARIRWTALADARPNPPSADDILDGPPHLADEVQRRYDQLLEDLRFCLQHQPEQRWIRDTLAEVLRDLRDVDGLVDHYEAWAHIQSAGPGRATILMRLGQVHEQLRRDLPSAAEAYELAVAEDPRGTSPLRALGRVYEQLQRWPQALATLRKQAAATHDGPDRLAALRRVAAIAEHELRDIDVAIETLEEIARVDQDDILSLYQLAALCRAHDRPKQLLATLQLLVLRLDDDVARTATLLELGEVQEHRLEQPAAARESYERALSLSPGYTPALRVLGRIYREAGDFDALLRLHDPEVDPITDPAILALGAGRICFEELTDIDRAIDYLYVAYNNNPDLAPARELLLQLLGVSGRVREAYDLLRAQDLPQSPALLADYHYRLGLAAEALAAADPTDGRPLVDQDRALQHYRAALSIQHEHDLALDRARRLLLAQNDVPNLIRLLEDQLPHTQGAAKAALQIQLARLYQGRTGEQTSVRSLYEAAIESSPEDGLLRREFENLLRQTDEGKELPAIRLALARISEDTHYKATLLVESAEALLVSGAIEDREFAANAILGALREDPGNPYAVRQLEGLLSDPRSPVAMTDAVGARAVRAQSDSERAIFYLESAELLERAGATNEAQRAYRAALRAMPGLQPAEMGLTRIQSGSAREQSAPKAKAV